MAWQSLLWNHSNKTSIESPLYEMSCFTKSLLGQRPGIHQILKNWLLGPAFSILGRIERFFACIVENVGLDMDDVVRSALLAACVLKPRDWERALKVCVCVCVCVPFGMFGSRTTSLPMEVMTNGNSLAFIVSWMDQVEAGLHLESRSSRSLPERTVVECRCKILGEATVKAWVFGLE